MPLSLVKCQLVLLEQIKHINCIYNVIEMSYFISESENWLIILTGFIWDERNGLLVLLVKYIFIFFKFHCYYYYYYICPKYTYLIISLIWPQKKKKKERSYHLFECLSIFIKIYPCALQCTFEFE